MEEHTEKKQSESTQPMQTRFVSVLFTKRDASNVIAQVETGLTGRELESRVAVSHQWMEDYFGEEWESWEIESVTEVTEDWDILKNRHCNPYFDQQLNEAPLFEIDEDDEM